MIYYPSLTLPKDASDCVPVSFSASEREVFVDSCESAFILFERSESVSASENIKEMDSSFVLISVKFVIMPKSGTLRSELGHV